MRECGYDIEEHNCSSDNGSLDGVKIPAIGVTLLDGTAPMKDVKLPRVVSLIPSCDLVRYRRKIRLLGGIDLVFLVLLVTPYVLLLIDLAEHRCPEAVRFFGRIAEGAALLIIVYSRPSEALGRALLYHR